jgi:hypothetical protein
MKLISYRISFLCSWQFRKYNWYNWQSPVLPLHAHRSDNSSQVNRNLISINMNLVSVRIFYCSGKHVTKSACLCPFLCLCAYSVNNLYKYLALSQVFHFHMPTVRGIKHCLCFDIKQTKIMLSLYKPFKHNGRVEVPTNLSLKLGTRWRWVVNRTPIALPPL